MLTLDEMADLIIEATGCDPRTDEPVQPNLTMDPATVRIEWRS